MDERIRFVARLLEGEKMASLCRQFSISRKTGYKIFERYKECGLEALTDRSRRPWRYGQQLPQQVEVAILNLKRDKPHWGARKIRERLLRRFSCEVKVPARSTIHAVLDRHGLVQRRGRKRHHAQGTPLSLGQKPNELWCTDYKGEFLLGNKKYCYPLTVTDHASRYLLLCELLNLPVNPLLLLLLSACSKNAACLGASVRTTAFPSPQAIRYLISPNSRSGGCVWASPSNASNPVIHNRMVGMSACISHSKTKPLALPV
jgi:transposase InsO family protein